MNVAAIMKNFLDRFAYTLHRPRFFDQQAMIVCTTGAVGLKEAIDRLAVIKFAGFNLVHTAGFVTPESRVSRKSKGRSIEVFERGKQTLSCHGRQKTVTPGLINLIAFRSNRQHSLYPMSRAFRIAIISISRRKAGWTRIGSITSTPM